MNKYLSFGGGVNSVALHLLLLEQGEDFESVFVHHGTDWPETYEYVAMFQWWLKAQGCRPITILRPNEEGYQSIYNYALFKQTIPVMFPRWCTHRFKKKVVENYYIKPCFQHLGIDYGEAHRAKIQTAKGIETRYPLIENEIDRDGCIQVIRKHGLPVPPKSGCFICPYQKRQQWIELRRKHPCLFQAAVELENTNNKRRKAIGKEPFYIASNGTSLGAVIDENQGVLFEEYEYPPCQCGL